METKLTQKELVKASGLSDSEISRILNGKRRVTLRQAEALRKCTGLDEKTWLYPETYPGNPYLKKQ